MTCKCGSQFLPVLEKQIKCPTCMVLDMCKKNEVNEKDYYGRQFWIIKSSEKEFAYYGTEAEAEQHRKDSSRNQFAFASKRLATQSEEDCRLIERDCTGNILY